MNSKDIYIGEVKRCTDMDLYQKYGSERYVGDFIIGHQEIGRINRYVDSINKEALLLKVEENEYVWLDSLNNKFEEFLLNMGIIPVKTLGTSPVIGNRTFVDEDTLKPCFNGENIYINVKNAKAFILASKK